MAELVLGNIHSALSEVGKEIPPVPAEKIEKIIGASKKDVEKINDYINKINQHIKEMSMKEPIEPLVKTSSSSINPSAENTPPRSTSASSGLASAISTDNVREVNRYIRSGIDLSILNKEKKTPLIQAAEKGNIEILSALLKHAKEKDFDKSFLESRDEEGNTALMLAASKREIQVMELLIKAGANIEACDDKGNTLFILAALTGELGVMHTLLNAKANVEAQNKKGGTPLIWAVTSGQIGAIEMLISHGAQVDACDHQENTPLMWAAAKGKTEAIQMLLHAKPNANIEASNKDGMTALMMAVSQGQTSSIEALIDEKANIEACDREGNTALLVALRNKQTHAAKMLIEKKANIEACDHEGQGALYFAISVGDKEIIDLLKNNHIDQEFIERKCLAHVWGMDGLSKLNRTIGSPVTMDLEGLFFSISLDILSRYVSDFFQSNPNLNSTLLKSQAKICDAISHTITILPTNADNESEIFSKIKEGNPVFIAGGFTRHAISIVIGKNPEKSDEYQIMISNRGAGMSENAIEFYSMPLSNFNEETIKGFRKRDYEDATAFNQMLKNLTLTPTKKGITQKPQMVGNCTWVGSKNAFRMLCEWYTDRETATETYKTFSRDFVREKALMEYLEIVKRLM